MPMDNLFPSESDGIVVVGHVSMNTKKNARKLQKIAENNTKKVYANVRNTQKSQYPSKNLSVQESMTQYAYPSKNQYQQKSYQNHYENSESYYGYSNDKYNQYPQHQRQKQGGARHGGGSTTKAIVPATRAPVEQPAGIMELIALPDDVLATIIRLTGVNSIATLSATCQVVSGSFGDSSTGFWSAFAGPSASAICRQSLQDGARNAVRRFIFGLEGQWFPAFSRYAETHADPVEVLNEADYLVGGLIKVEKCHAAGLVRLIVGAVKRCVTDYDTAASYLSTTLRKMESRREVFNSKAVHEIREAELDLREKVILARMEVDEDDTPGFDYFQTEAIAATDPDAWVEWGDEPKQAPATDEDLEFANSFLELLAPGP